MKRVLSTGVVVKSGGSCHSPETETRNQELVAANEPVICTKPETEIVIRASIGAEDGIGRSLGF